MVPRDDHTLCPRPRRRDILAFGAGLALLPIVSWAERGRRGNLAIGYYPETPAGAEDTLTPRVASRLAAGDLRLAHGVRVIINGLVGDVSRLPSLGIRSADLSVGFTVEGPVPSEVEFRAWSYQLLPVTQFASPISFEVPVEAGLGLNLDIETLGNERFSTVLSIGSEPGVPKLRAGRYLIAPGAKEFSARRFDPARSEPMIAFSVEPLV